MSERKIDIYNHVMPRAVADRIRELAPGRGDMVKRVTSIPMLYDIEARIRMMDQWPAYQQVLTLSNPHHTFIKRGKCHDSETADVLDCHD